MSREGPINFGKPLLYLVIVGVIGTGIYLWRTWPATYEGVGWKVDFPNGWETSPYREPSNPVNVRGMSKVPLKEEGVEGVARVTVNRHGTLDWPRFAIDMIPGGAPDKTLPDEEIAHKKAMFFEYQDDKNMRYTGT